jgi:protein involved in polysaccharide export with SLBB domain
MFELPHRVEPPDLITIEVLEALPGRPISGERLVRPDGMISLSFYGEIYVRGLTPTQIKEKVILHLRKFLPDEVLGLVEQDELGNWQDLEPKDSNRVFVDVTAYNSKNYFIQGDVAAPGKLPCTGNETVLDALNYAGGFIPSADSENIRLVRPRGDGQPPAIYKVDYDGILKFGEIESNYQLFPGDRLVVGRKPGVAVERTVLTRGQGADDPPPEASPRYFGRGPKANPPLSPQPVDVEPVTPPAQGAVADPDGAKPQPVATRPAGPPPPRVPRDDPIWDLARIKPEPLPPIPHAPAPHEGAMFDLPYVAAPPDIIRVEVLQTLPGRPISGERLVRADGMVSFGFYGDIYVRGLTLPQIKHKLIVHLRKFLTDEMLGLVAQDEEGKWQFVKPQDSNKVFVNVSASPSKIYFVQGDVEAPGKLAWTANDTVLGALNSAKGLLKTADPRNIRLVRPGRDGQPSRVYKIDHEAILERGEIAQNYQLFPGDRLIVGRNPVMPVTLLDGAKPKTDEVVFGGPENLGALR